MSKNRRFNPRHILFLAFVGVLIITDGLLSARTVYSVEQMTEKQMPASATVSPTFVQPTTLLPRMAAPAGFSTGLNAAANIFPRLTTASRFISLQAKLLAVLSTTAASLFRSNLVGTWFPPI